MANIIINACRRYSYAHRSNDLLKEIYRKSYSDFFYNVRNNLCHVKGITTVSSGNCADEINEHSAQVSSKIYHNKQSEHNDLQPTREGLENTQIDVLPPYIKLQDNNPLISQAVIAVKSKKSKRTAILLEGRRLISEAIKYGIDPKIVFFSRKEDIKKIRWPSVDFKLYKVPYRILKVWSFVETSPGVLGIFKKPEAVKNSNDFIPLTVVCDNIRDPGNLGSILRVAAGVGCRSVLLTKGCVDVWEPKVLRSGAGAHFVIPVHQDCTWKDIIEKYMDDESTVVLADNCTSILNERLRGISSQAEISLPLKEYHKVDYSGAWEESSGIVLVLGGETEGLSMEACELAESRDGIRLHIPLYNEVESLNASTAVGVIAFEIRRQYEEWSKKIKTMPLLQENNS